MSTKCPKCLTDNAAGSKFCSTCGLLLDSIDKIPLSQTKTIETPAEELTTGSTFAERYQIIEELGKGGMGRVYKALDKEINEKIALKLIKPDIASDKKTIERFRNELKVTRKIGHKNVGRMYDLNKEKGNYFITMEYISGQDLKGLIRQTGQLTVGKAVSIAKQICDGLSEAHNLGVVHRDLKPNNIMIDEGGNARIMDFGIARAVKGKSLTGSGVVIGTPQYMSPEQVEGQETDVRSDIYSLGIILYEMLTARVPFEGDTPLTVGVKQKTESPREPRDFNERIPDGLNQLILKCLEKDKEYRYQSAEEIKANLEKLEQGLPTTDRVVPQKKPLTSKEVTVTFKKRWAFLFVPFVIVLAAVLILFVFNRRKESPLHSNPKIIVLPFENLNPAQDESFALGIADGIRSRLSILHNLDVISRDTAISYKNTEKTATQIKEETKADFILTGTVQWAQKEGEISRVRISPSLTQTLDDTQIWSDEIDRDIQDIFVVQSDIADQVTQQLGLILQPDELKVLEERPTENQDAYMAYVRGLDHWGTFELRENLEVAIQMFDLAVELDPHFALAYGYLVKSHSYMYHGGYDMTEDRIARARAAVDRMVELEPELPDTHAALGTFYYWCLKDYHRALQELSLAEKDLPNDPYIKAMIGYIRRRQGDFKESLRLMNRSLELNPKDITVALNIGITYLSLRDYPEAERYFDGIIAVSPEFPSSYIFKGLTYWLWNGDITKIRDLVVKMPHYSDPHVVYSRYLVEMGKENYSEALEILSTASIDVFPTNLGFFVKDMLKGEAYTAMGEADRALASFEAARLFLEAEVQKSPLDPRIRSSLGMVYAALDRKEEALREGKKAMELYPISLDAFEGPSYVQNFAQILVRVGEYDQALDQIEALLEIPSMISVASLQNSPAWEPLWELSRFEQILKKHSQ